MQQASAWPVVSVVMPSFNQAEFIDESIRSVLRQPHQGLELIVADGGSTDGTLDVLARWRAVDPRLRWFSGKDAGPADALNQALRQVRGTLVGWLNSDDLYTPGALARAVAAFAAQPDLMMVYGHGEHVDAEGRVLDRYPTLPPGTPLRQFADGCFICQPTVFFKRTMPLLLGPLDTGLETAFDFDYWLRAFLTFPGRIGFVDAVLAQSRLHDACITRTMRRTVAVEGLQVLHRHLGLAPGHWVLTHLNEVLAGEDIADVDQYMRAMLAEVQPLFGEAQFQALQSQVGQALGRRRPRVGQ